MLQISFHLSADNILQVDCADLDSGDMCRLKSWYFTGIPAVRWKLPANHAVYFAAAQM